ncbi:secretin [Rousettus aegyptiacus]|uniref:Secretin n=1 Tax=Rousettus aegyptiacus TaxID=9407 RepID=A0A7J8H5X1_ROUAE|nr:secretin [Rousettus aegyptiacus]KAF6467653.1 secretin [Rousettus aegyptiacus]
MAPRARLLLLLLLPPLLAGSAARPAPPRAPRHSDGMFTSELSRLRESARLHRLLQGLVGKRSQQDPDHSTSWTKSAGGPLCLPRFHMLAPQAWVPLGQAWSPRFPPGLRSGLSASEPAGHAGTHMRS